MPDLADSLHWARLGADTFAKVLAALDDDQFQLPSSLGGFTRAELAWHVIELVADAATALNPGTDDPGSTPDEAAVTEAPDTGPELREAYRLVAKELNAALALRPNRGDWADPVDFDGQEHVAAEVLFQVASELLIHATDLSTPGPEDGDRDTSEVVTLGRLPVEFLGAFISQIMSERGHETPQTLEILSQDTGEGWRLEGPGDAMRVMGRASDVVAWLGGRPGGKVKVLGQGTLPDIGPWF